MAASEGTIAHFDLIVVPFPYIERLAEKRRPALVISDTRLHREGYLWIALITGAGKERRTGDLVIKDLAQAGLLVRRWCARSRSQRSNPNVSCAGSARLGGRNERR